MLEVSLDLDTRFTTACLKDIRKVSLYVNNIVKKILIPPRLLFHGIPLNSIRFNSISYINDVLMCFVLKVANCYVAQIISFP